MSIFPNGKLPIYVDSQLRYIRLAQIRAEAQATREAESRKLMAQEIAKAIQATQSGNSKRGRHERAKGVTDKWIAQQFSQYAQPLICRCYRNDKEGDEERIREIIPELKKEGKRYFQSKEYGGLCVYEPMRGGDRLGYATVGKITPDGIKKWIGKHRDESNPEPRSGFHAGMLKNKTSIEEAAKQWGNYCHGYALAFFNWRKTHTGTPRNQFRYSPPPVIHGAEYKATAAPRS